MMQGYVVVGDRLKRVDDCTANLDNVVWADLMNPTREEEAAIEAWLGVGIPTREEMEEIEISSRLYVENGFHFMTASLPSLGEDDALTMMPVTFVLAGKHLITVRYHEPRAFKTFPAHAEKAAIGCTTGQTVLVGLLEAIVDRLADILEKVGHDIVHLSHDIFHPTAKKASKRDSNFQRLLKAIGRKEDITSGMSESLMTLQRLSGFLQHATSGLKDKELQTRVKTLGRDISSLADYANLVSQKITFLLDATLGMINIEQNAIIKIVSVAAVVFLPPTLVASIYGMNFQIIPELSWSFGYPLALFIMVISAVLPFAYFKRRGWL
ncbi:MAG: magnesium transporter CorA family protein [Rhizobiaceae bacterium]|nr:magnesium transporter CorA family protein [Rhizobiaceae bacterium]